MRVTRYLDDVVIWAPAKLNLFLEILGKRPDGYHELATLMVAVRLFDTLVLRNHPAGTLHLCCTRLDLDLGANNLVLRAANLLRQHTGCQRGAHLRLVKRIPLEAGLGGGSSDAAATLVGLNLLWNLGLKLDELAKLGSQLGSDVPFFLAGPAAWCTGRGEITEPVVLTQTLDFVIIQPGFGCSTAQVYQQLSLPTAPVLGQALRHAVETGNRDAIAQGLHNRLEEPAFRLEPRLAQWKHRLHASQPAGCLMSGSGSALFALARSPADALRIAQNLAAQTPHEPRQIYLARSCL
jgi:4-diphosphocytidyl-2-C-methyl-D-erythritol kinase